jgi:hypothetical protein
MPFSAKHTVYKKRIINKANPNFTMVVKKKVIGVQIPVYTSATQKKQGKAANLNRNANSIRIIAIFN